MRSGSKPPLIGSPTSSPGKVMLTLLRCGVPKPSGSSPNPPKRCNCSASIKTTTGTEPPNPPIMPRNPIWTLTPRWQVEQQPIPDPASTGENAHRSLQLMPPPFDPDRARPRAVIYVHLSEEALTAGTGVARVEDVGPVLLGRLRSLLGDRCSISVKPVIDLPAGHTPVDCYEIPARLREQLQLRYPADVFPYAAGVSRRMDMDHTIAYLSPDRGGPPGQTRIGNLGPHVRRNHRHKTHGGWQVRQPEPGVWLWRSPHRRIYLVNATGTHPLGNTKFAEAIWRTAGPPGAGELTRTDRSHVGV